ncbi:MAG: Signal transduction histidine kinase [Rhodospirillales bacterium]|nr:Signal transduction histidine kinase [Rhodospirillales bacterium]
MTPPGGAVEPVSPALANEKQPSLPFVTSASRQRTGDVSAAALLRDAAIALRPLFAAEEAGLAILDADGHVVAANAGYVLLAGGEASATAGSAPPPATLVAPSEREALRRLIEAAMDGPPAPAPIELRPADPNAAADACLLISCRPLRAEPGVLLRVADATHRRRLERELAEAGRLQAVGALAGGVAHDFNNLLTAIMGSAEAVQDLAPSAAIVEEMVRILDAATRGGQLVRQLLAFAGQQALQPRLVPLDGAVRGIAALLPRLLGGGVRLTLALGAAGDCVIVDPGQLDQVLLNLAVNARDAMSGGGELRLATRRETLPQPRAEASGTIPAGDWAVLEVGDSGPGIAPEILPRIFEPFFTTRREAGGTGLGLATVHGIVQQSGGYLSVASEGGVGTVFSLWFPRRAAEPVVAVAPPPARVVRPATPAHVLLVDDEPMIRRLAERTLVAAGYRVTLAEDAEAALDLLPEGATAPDLLLTDVSMPGMDGVELAQRLQRQFPTLRVLLVSGYSGRLLGLDLDAARLQLLAKPYRAAELIDAVASILKGPALLAATEPALSRRR